MKAHELRGGTETTVEVRPSEARFDPAPPRRLEVGLRRVRDELVLLWESRAVPVEGIDPKARATLIETIDSGLPVIAWCARADIDRATVHMRSYHGLLRIDQPLVIGIDEGALEELRRNFGVSGGVLEACQWLEEHLLVPGPDPARRRAAISGGPQPSQEAFRMFGRGVSLDVRREGDRLRIEHLVKFAPAGQGPVHLLDAPVSFADVTATGAMAATARSALEQAVKSAGSYLRVWSTYAELERQAILRRARRIGALRYDSFTRRPDGGFRFRLATVSDLEARLAGLDEDDRFELEASDSAPDLESFDDRRSRGGARLSAPVSAVDARQFIIDLRAPEDDDDQPAPPPQGYLSMSLAGDRARLRRRETAEEKLRTGTSLMPHLGLLLEGHPGARATRRQRSERSAAVLDAFGGTPTGKQLEALRAAINTPDIALIQGPPGTGKTRVITALQCRLAELAEEGVELSHRILVSSAQHDAVENVVQRSEVFGLPAVKIGGRRGDDGAGLDSVEIFRTERIDRLRASLREPPEQERAAKARQIAMALLRAPTPPTETATHLRNLAASVTDLISPALRDRVLRRASSLDRPAHTSGDPEVEELCLAAARGIRISAVAFEDDGPVKARKALVRLKGILSPEEQNLLDMCAEWVEPHAPPWLDRVQSMKEALLDRLLVAPPVANVTADPATQELLIEVIDALETRRMRSGHGEHGVLAAYLSDLQNDPAAVREALEHYTVVLAATCQQAAGGAMRAVRGVETGWPEFETVIVDEAARSNPLDLFIPMTMARRRVVLVGDHRQLPHMLEPDVERDVAAAVQAGSLAQEAQTALKESLFGRLWDLLKKLEREDGIPRTVRLDTQYRMHHVLGDFVSEMFYERRGDGKLHSGAPAAQLSHDLAGYQKGGTPCPAAWLDVPGGPGQWEQRGRSKSRPIEAKRIARELKILIEAAPQLTFGIVAFYSAQVQAIAEALIREGLAERTEAGGWRIAERWRRTENERGERAERLRLGSVDAFQGKEFDVVILSVTRSNDLPGDTEEDRRRKYGHLLLDNRLCVAMSRQRRLLIVAGDRAFAAQNEHLAPLKRFSSLCEGPHGTVRS